MKQPVVLLMLAGCLVGCALSAARATAPAPASAFLQVNGLSPLFESAEISALEIRNGRLTIVGASGGSRIQIEVSPIPAAVTLPACAGCTVKAAMHLLPDGPVQRVQIWRGQELLLAAAHGTREGQQLLEDWRAYPGPLTGESSREGRTWVALSLRRGSTELRAFPGTALALPAGSLPWRIFLIGASIPAPPSPLAPHSSGEQPRFMADWIAVPAR